METALKYFAPGDCYEVVFVNFNFFDGKEILAEICNWKHILDSLHRTMFLSGPKQGLELSNHTWCCDG